MSRPELRAELGDLVASLRAYVEWQEDTGASGFPRAPKESAAPTTTSPARLLEAPRVQVPDAKRPETPERVPEAERAAPASDSPRVVRLGVIGERVKTCEKCGLAAGRTNAVFARGNPEASVAFVGEAPGADEDAQGLPFVGRAGQLLDKMITAMGLSPERDVYVCNIIKCRPPGNRRPEPVEMETCLPYLHEQLDIVSPKVIVALGNTAVSALLGTKLGITKVRGEWKFYRGKVPVMPTFHPSYLLRPSAQQTESKRQAWEDLQAVMKELGLPPRPAR